MSDTNDTPQAEPDPPESTAEGQPEPETGEEKPSKLDRRIAALSARVSAAEARAQQAEAEATRYRQHSPLEQQRPELTPELRVEVERLAAQMREQERGREKAESFHELGRESYADWEERCKNLIAMGADNGVAEILVEMKDGARIAGALADDPEALQRISSIKTERGRAISLGMYAASLADKAPPPLPRRAARESSGPIRPITNLGNGSVPVPQAMTSEQLVDYYSREAMKARGL